MPTNIDQQSAREAATGDFSGIMKLLQGANLPTGDLTPGVGHFLVIELDKKIVGVAGLQIYTNLGLLRSVAVDKGYRNRLLATLLVDKLLGYASEQGVTAVYLITTSAEHYFSKKGFAVVDRENVPAAIKSSSEFSTVCPSTATVMMKELHKR